MNGTCADELHSRGLAQVVEGIEDVHSVPAREQVHQAREERLPHPRTQLLRVLGQREGSSGVRGGGISRRRGRGIRRGSRIGIGISIYIVIRARAFGDVNARAEIEPGGEDVELLIKQHPLHVRRGQRLTRTRSSVLCERGRGLRDLVIEVRHRGEEVVDREQLLVRVVRALDGRGQQHVVQLVVAHTRVGVHRQDVIAIIVAIIVRSGVIVVHAVVGDAHRASERRHRGRDSRDRGVGRPAVVDLATRDEARPRPRASIARASSIGTTAGVGRARRAAREAAAHIVAVVGEIGGNGAGASREARGWRASRGEAAARRGSVRHSAIRRAVVRGGRSLDEIHHHRVQQQVRRVLDTLYEEDLEKALQHVLVGRVVRERELLRREDVAEQTDRQVLALEALAERHPRIRLVAEHGRVRVVLLAALVEAERDRAAVHRLRVCG